MTGNSILKRSKLLGLCLAVIVFGGSAFAAGVMRDIPALEIVRDMKIGWNLGNSLDATNGSGLGTETSWNNPKTTKAMIDALCAKGFRTIRVPVTWNKHFGAAPAYAIDKEWLDRVEEVIKYIIDNKMYAILNSHHDDWVTLTASSQAQICDKIVKLWTQIAARFKDYGDYLVFEALNEPRLIGTPYEWTGGTAEARTVLNSYNLSIVNTIRAGGGNNALRLIMIPTHAASTAADAQDALVVPSNDKRIIVSQHTYFPYHFSMDTSGTNAWGSASDKAACDAELDRICEKFVKKGIPVIIGEWGSINKNNTAARVAHAEYYTLAVRKRGMLPIWWDNGNPERNGFAIFNRSACAWYFPEIADGLVKSAQVGVSPAPNDEKRAASSAPVIASGAVRYTLSGSSLVSLRIYDMRGRRIDAAVECVQGAGEYVRRLPVDKVSPGTCILELKTGDNLVTKAINVTHR